MKRWPAKVEVREPELRITPRMEAYLRAEAAADLTREAMSDALFGDGWAVALREHCAALITRDDAWFACRPFDRYHLGLHARLCHRPSAQDAAIGLALYGTARGQAAADTEYADA